MPPSTELTSPLAELPDHGYVYRTSWPVATYDMDTSQHLRLDGVARYIQEVGAENLTDAGMADVHPHWIVQRTVIDVIQPIAWPAVISFQRWCSGMSTRWCTMRVRLDGDDGGRIETEGFWINMNKETQTPSRISDDFFDRFATTTDNHRLKWRPWLDTHVESDTVTPFPLRVTDIDHFRHVNNTVYWHAIHEVLASAPEFERAPYRAVLEYRQPIQPQEAVELHSAVRDDGLRIWFVVAGEARACALVRPLAGDAQRG
ncbi:acyl-[Mycobacterium sp. MYCO198283]|uniref:acyl-[acyl-carrier-protein] thioesterase n=1 Tax=Mycobacterium sp. MYCO198283 TaxID=2883505 RepID=UPI001E3E9B7A|nr:acyl-[acyl-carrier-protein] thioesterase [Mycobacterium sp. MYCO198283]MCG5432938.1 acyl-[acyl-carrier-protein] thioesterase [Mycobacterium sp. MYCO198283]